MDQEGVLTDAETYAALLEMMRALDLHWAADEVED